MEIARHWRLKKQRYALVGQQCEDCGEKFFPSRMQIDPQQIGKPTSFFERQIQPQLNELRGVVEKRASEQGIPVDLRVRKQEVTV